MMLAAWTQRNRHCRTVAAVVALTLIPFANGLADDHAPPQKGESFSSSPVFQDQQGQRLLAARCTVCHSTDLIVQQRLTRDQWITVVNKMVHWGAQLSEAERDALIGHLVSHYHPGASGVRD